MEEKIKERMKSAYEGIALDEELRSRAKENLLAKARNSSRKKITYKVMAAAAVIVIFILGNIMLIQLNLEHGNKVTPVESEKETLVESENTFQKELLSELLLDSGAESFLIEHNGEAYREGRNLGELEEILKRIVVTSLSGENAGESLIKITLQGKDDELTVQTLEIFDNYTVEINGNRYQIMAELEVYQKLEDFQIKYFDNEIMSLDQVQTVEDIKKLALCPNAYVKELEEDFYVVILCFDENGVRTGPQSGLTSIKHSQCKYYQVLNGDTLEEYAKELTGWNKLSEGCGIYGAGKIYGKWCEVIDFSDAERDYYLSMEYEDEGRYIAEFNERAEVWTNTQFFVDSVSTAKEDIVVIGDVENTGYGDVFEFYQVNTKRDLEKLMEQPNAYSIKYSDAVYLVVLARGAGWWLGTYTVPANSIEIGLFEVAEENASLENEMEFIEFDCNISEMGFCCYKGNYYLVCTQKDTAKYRIIGLSESVKTYDEEFYCDEGICPGILNEDIIYFARHVNTGDYNGIEKLGEWYIGDNIGPETKFDVQSYCESHDWDDMCTSSMTVRDIYVAQNWVGRNVNDFTALECFFDETATVWHEDGNLFQTEESAQNAYQINTSFSTLRFEVSTEVNANEIISVTIYGDHNYVTEDVWLGMNMADVKKIMNIDDSAFFEKDGALFSFFEKDGYLYEFSYRSMPGGNYWLYLSCISDAAKIKDSPVKSFGEQMEEGRNIFAQ